MDKHLTLLGLAGLSSFNPLNAYLGTRISENGNKNLGLKAQEVQTSSDIPLSLAGNCRPYEQGNLVVAPSAGV
jgi:hypothetical protein